MRSSILLSFFLFILSNALYSQKQDLTTNNHHQKNLNHDNFALITSNIANNDVYAIEFGFIGKKKLEKYNFVYNSLVTPFMLEQKITNTDIGITTNSTNSLKSAILGVKAGLLIPTNPYLGLSIYSVLGYAKSSVAKDPWFGKNEQQLKKRDVFLLEYGLIFHHDRYLLRTTFIHSNLKYYNKKLQLSIGINF